MITELKRPQPILSEEQTTKILSKLRPIYRKFKKEDNKAICREIRTMARSLLCGYSEIKEANYISKKASKLWKSDAI